MKPKKIISLYKEIPKEGIRLHIIKFYDPNDTDTEPDTEKESADDNNGKGTPPFSLSQVPGFPSYDEVKIEDLLHGKWTEELFEDGTFQKLFLQTRFFS